MNYGTTGQRHYVICNWRDSAHPRAGGAELYCEEVARHIRRNGDRVTLVTSRPAPLPAREETDFGTVVRLGGTFGTYFRGLMWLARHRSGIDGVIDSENGIPYFAPLAVGPKTPVVLLMHHVHQDQFAKYWPPAAARLGRIMEKWGVRTVYRRRPVCAVSPSTRVEIRRRLGFRGPVYLATNGLNARGGGEPAPRAPKPTIVCVGRLVPHKRFELLVEAISDLTQRWPDLCVHLVGDGPARPRIEALAKDRAVTDRLVVHGRLEEQERDRLLSSAWLTVNPTAGEGWGLSVVEAAALGVPAVAFDVPGMQDSVRPGDTGWLARDGELLADVIHEALHALSDPSQAEQWRQRCRAWAESFRWDVTATRLQSVLDGERDRLSWLARDRRSHSDTATVAAVPKVCVSLSVLRRLRRTDQVRTRAEAVELLLWGADEHDARRALERIGVEDTSGVEIRLARRKDQFGWGTPQAIDHTDLESHEETQLPEPEEAAHGTDRRRWPAAHDPGQNRWRWAVDPASQHVTNPRRRPRAVRRR